MKTDRRGRDTKWSGPAPTCLSQDSGGISQLQGPPLKARGLNPMPGFLVRSTSARKRSPHNIWLWKSAAITSTQVIHKAAKNQGVLLNGLHTNSHLQAFTLSSCKGMVEKGCQCYTGRDRVVRLWRQSWRNSHQHPCVESLFCTTNGCHLSWVEHGPFRALAWWATLAPPWRLPEALPYPTFSPM